MSFVTFGELMLRLTPSLHREKLQTTRQFDVNFAGSESNVASSLGLLGNTVSFVTKLPNNAMGDNAIQSLAKYGIDTSYIIRDKGRLGTYFIEMGSSIRPSKVIYDRKDSVFSKLHPDEFDWNHIFKNQKYLFVSGITAALSSSCAEALTSCVKLAKANGVKVAFDMNYRRTLWNNPKDAQLIFDKVLAYTDILFGNASVLKDVYGLKSTASNPLEKTLEVIELAKSKLGIAHYAFTIRNHISASINELQGVFVSPSETAFSSNYKVELLDRFGAGDAFAAACLHALLKEKSEQALIDFGTAAFVLKHTIYGDQHTSTAEDIQAVVNGDISGHVKR